MMRPYILLCLLWLSTGAVFGQQVTTARNQVTPRPKDVKIERFDLSDAILRDGVSELSLERIDGLHLGFEEIIRSNIQDDPWIITPHFSLHLRNKSVGEILDALCASDLRYIWSEDGDTINVYPRAINSDPSYLLNLRIDGIVLEDKPDPDQALTPLSKLFPAQQVGYFGPGLGDNTYPQLWTTTFEDLTVRQFVNRIAEHMGLRTAWIWQGGKGERMFTFVKGGFHTIRADRPEPGAP